MAVERHKDMPQNPVYTGKCRILIPRDPFRASLRSRNAHGHVTSNLLRGNLQGKCRTRLPRQPFCASLHNRNAHAHVTRAILCGNLQGKCWTHPPWQARRLVTLCRASGRLTPRLLRVAGTALGDSLQGLWIWFQTGFRRLVSDCFKLVSNWFQGPSFCANLRVELRMDMSQGWFCVEIYKENAGRVARGHRFVRACAVEMHMHISQEPFCVEIYRENAKRDGYHLDWTPGLNTYRKNRSVWPHCWGEKWGQTFSEWEGDFWTHVVPGMTFAAMHLRSNINSKVVIRVLMQALQGTSTYEK